MQKNQAEKTFSLLFVDDEQTAREIVAKMLSRQYPGVHIDTAENGAAGLDLFMKSHHDLVITDYRMPRMNGVQMISSIRMICPGTPVIFLTASISESALQDTQPKECTFLLRKPFQFHELFSLIDRHAKLP